MRKTLVGVVSLAVMLSFCWAPSAVAQEEGQGMSGMSEEQAAMMQKFMEVGTPGEPHDKLAEMAGMYDLEIRSYMDPGGEPTVSEGTAERTMMFDRHLEEKVTSDMMGHTFHGVGMTGYDNVTGTYWSTWFDSMSTGLIQMTGDWDGDKKVWVWKGEAPDPLSGGMKPMKVLVYPTDTGERSEFYEPFGGEDMVKTMEIVYTKK